jgi:hypothetical protein
MLNISTSCVGYIHVLFWFSEHLIIGPSNGEFGATNEKGLEELLVACMGAFPLAWRMANLFI